MAWELSLPVIMGARNFTKIKEAVAATWILGFLLSIAVMLMGFLGLYPLLQYLDTPAEILPQSYQYISMIVTCVGVSFAIISLQACCDLLGTVWLRLVF